MMNGAEARHWLKANRYRLVCAGVPDEVLASARSWAHFANHSFDPETGWDPNRIDDEQAAALLEVVKSWDPTCVLAEDLERRLGVTTQPRPG